MLYQYILSIYKWRWAHINAFNLFSCALENRTSILVQAVLVNRLDLSRSYIVYIIVRNMNDISSLQILPIAFFISTKNTKSLWKRLNYKSLIPESFLFYRFLSIRYQNMTNYHQHRIAYNKVHAASLLWKGYKFYVIAYEYSNYQMYVHTNDNLFHYNWSIKQSLFLTQ